MVFKKRDPAGIFQALNLVKVIRERLEEGFRFYNPKTRKRLETVDEITKCIQKVGSVDQQPPEGGEDEEVLR